MPEPKKIMLLEDDLEFGIILARALEHAGYEVARFTKALRALEHFDAQPVDLVLSDILVRVDGELTRDGGIKLISRIRQVDGNTLPIIAMSSMFNRDFGGIEARSTAKTVGASETLAKPFKFEELEEMITRLLARAEAKD
ncbi:MAG: response regulator [Litoreibacter sp.]|nr:response regulator [Litoreibacter sp.]MCY4333950.1 response regulator [Litoreibacter sp.]